MSSLTILMLAVARRWRLLNFTDTVVTSKSALEAKSNFVCNAYMDSAFQNYHNYTCISMLVKL